MTVRRICSSLLVLSIWWLLSILIGRLLTVWRLAVGIWLLLVRRRTRHGSAPRHSTRADLPTSVQGNSGKKQKEKKLGE
jgi:hypothetical protein